MKTRKVFFLATKIYGLIVSFLLLLIIGLEVVGSAAEGGIGDVKEVGHYLINWYDNPIGFFTTYFIGYIILWWKKIAGAIIIISACILAHVANPDNPGWFIFTIPTFMVGLLYLIHWQISRKPG